MEEQTGSLFSENYPKIKQLLELNHKLCDLGSAMAVLGWDQETYMPKGGAEARGNQLATLSSVAHKVLTSKRVGLLLDALYEASKFKWPESEDMTIYDKALIRQTRRAYDRLVKVPSKLVEEMTIAVSLGTELWQKARKESNFSIFRDALKRVLDLKLEEASYVGYKDTPYNLFLDDHEPGLTVDVVDNVFASLKDITRQVLAKIQQSEVKINQDILKNNLPEERLMDFTNLILTSMGFDFECGRQDKSMHPFTTSFDPTDVRVTTRFGEQFFTSIIYSSIHEGGHALYEQGVDRRLSRTLLATGASLGIHESQSRLWENMVGRSQAFWDYWWKEIQSLLPGEIYNDGVADMVKGKYEKSDFVRAINRVVPNYIRVDSDEVTYNLHIVLRYEIERELIDGRISVDDLPRVWNEKIYQYLGLEVPNDTKGVLQDVHWSHGSFGYFPTYSLGNLYAAQIFDQLQCEFPGFNKIIAVGDTKFVRQWLREKLHKYGATYQAHELIKMMTGKKLSSEYFLKYLAQKFGPIYNFDPAELLSKPIISR